MGVAFMFFGIRDGRVTRQPWLPERVLGTMVLIDYVVAVRVPNIGPLFVTAMP